MSLDLDRINGLLRIVRETTGHPSTLASINALAMKELVNRNRDAKVELDKILADEAKEAEAQRQDALKKQQQIAAEEAKRGELTLRPQPTAEQIKADLDVAAAKQQALDEVEAKRLADEAELRRETASAEVQVPPAARPATDFDPGPDTPRRRLTSEVD